MFNKMIAGIIPYMPKSFVWIFSKSYIAGTRIEDAIRVSNTLNQEGCMVTIDLLGEFITNLKQAEENKEKYLNIIETIQKSQVQGNYSLKPTMFGLLLDKEICYRNIREIVAKAVAYDNFVRVDMEDSQCTDLEIELFRRLKAEFPKHVGLVLQAYLKRTLDDIKAMKDLHTPENPLNFRICKGIYVEPAAIAFKRYEEINENFLKIIDYMLEEGMYPGIATHDKALVEGSYELVRKHKTARNNYEFQMLYGVTPALRKSIVEKDHRMRIYVPFGIDWFAYSTRRLKENPKMASHIIKAIFVKG